jgi:hypothetical protein
MNWSAEHRLGPLQSTTYHLAEAVLGAPIANRFMGSRRASWFLGILSLRERAGVRASVTTDQSKYPHE